MVRLWPRQCIATKGTARSATSAGISGSASPPLTSLTREAPASSAAAATSARIVSTDTGASAPRASTTGMTRRSSSAVLGRSAPGRVDSPPTSSRSAPWATSSRPCATAASGVNHAPPSLNESGVTLTTPMTNGRPARGSGRVTGRSPLAAEQQRHRLGAGGGVAQLAAHGGGDGARARLLHPAHRHAQVLGLDDDDDALHPEVVDEGVGDLGGDLLLHLGAAGEDLDEPDRKSTRLNS